MSQRKTIISEMQVVEEALQASMHKVEVIEKKLRTKMLTDMHREKLEQELDGVKNVLLKNEKALKDLQHQNIRSFMVVASLVFVCFLFYGLYCLIFGRV